MIHFLFYIIYSFRKCPNYIYVAAVGRALECERVSRFTKKESKLIVLKNSLENFCRKCFIRYVILRKNTI